MGYLFQFPFDLGEWYDTLICSLSQSASGRKALVMTGKRQKPKRELVYIKPESYLVWRVHPPFPQWNVKIRMCRLRTSPIAVIIAHSNIPHHRIDILFLMLKVTGGLWWFQYNFLQVLLSLRRAFAISLCTHRHYRCDHRINYGTLGLERYIPNYSLGRIHLYIGPMSDLRLLIQNNK